MTVEEPELADDDDGAEDDGDDDETNDEGGVPGFGVIVALIGAAMLAARRNN
ncbi:hypothetical protein [Halalkalirubrum salinum]|uniref:hypothetical protein n=1 Tax=Halalkalirubrum salinum TaxID=2563889 RepID=UPI001484EF11|nr:hypothetical protein [Halalkalirubrum salinum]